MRLHQMVETAGKNTDTEKCPFPSEICRRSQHCGARSASGPIVAAMWLFVQRSGLGHHIGSGRLCDHENTHPYACCKDVGGHHLKKEQIDRVATVMATILVSGLTEQCQKLTPAADPRTRHQSWQYGSFTTPPNAARSMQSIAARETVPHWQRFDDNDTQYLTLRYEAIKSGKSHMELMRRTVAARDWPIHITAMIAPSPV